MRMFWSEISDMVTLFWKEDVYSVRKGEYLSRHPFFLVFLVIRLVESQAMALVLTSWYSKKTLN